MKIILPLSINRCHTIPRIMFVSHPAAWKSQNKRSPPVGWLVPRVLALVSSNETRDTPIGKRVRSCVAVQYALG